MRGAALTQQHPGVQNGVGKHPQGARRLGLMFLYLRRGSAVGVRILGVGGASGSRLDA